MHVTTLLRIYPSVLALCAIGSAIVCEWFHGHDLASRETHGDLSLKYSFTSGPQLSSAVLLLYYACTFHRAGSEFSHQLMAESCLHQSLASLLICSVLHSGFHMMHSGCCAFPLVCPIDVDDCQLGDIFQCPARLASIPHFDAVFRSAQVIATCVILCAMTSIGPIHRIKHLQARFRRAEFRTFNRRFSARPTSPTV